VEKTLCNLNQKKKEKGEIEDFNLRLFVKNGNSKEIERESSTFL